MKNKKIYIFIGTTAELIKLAPVIKEFKRRKHKFTIITSGQTEILFDELTNYIGKIEKIIPLKEKVHRSSVFYFIIWAIKTLFSALLLLRAEFKWLNKKNGYFLVHGDTVSSLIGALIAYIYRLKLVHIESGLRSFNFFEPFPEEICRYIISNLADIHFCPNQWCVNNLKGHKGIKINTKQNTILESLWMALKSKKHLEGLEKLKVKYFVLVIHRQEHVIFRKKWSKNMFEFIIKNSPQDLQCILIIHNLTSGFLKSMGYEKRNKKLIKTPRLPYTSFTHLMNNAEFVVTDGGSNQEELYYMGKPCLILRNATERIEGLGENAILSKGDKTVIKDFFKNYQKHRRAKVGLQNRPSKIIVDYLLSE